MTDDVRIPDAIEPIVGWRYWHLSTIGVLQSLNGARSTIWQPRQTVTARCRPGLDVFRYTHEAPLEGCSCGIYAARSLDDLRNVVKVLTGSLRLVVGTVSLWGKVIPGKQTYRAQFAYPKELMVLDGKGLSEERATFYAALLQAAYCVPARVASHDEHSPFPYPEEIQAIVTVVDETVRVTYKVFQKVATQVHNVVRNLAPIMTGAMAETMRFNSLYTQGTDARVPPPVARARRRRPPPNYRNLERRGNDWKLGG